MGMAFAVAFCLATAVLAIKGTDTNALVAALRVTARWSFLLFWVAYAGTAIGTLLGAPFETLAGRGRELGLAYAAAHLIHLGLFLGTETELVVFVERRGLAAAALKGPELLQAGQPWRLRQHRGMLYRQPSGT